MESKLIVIAIGGNSLIEDQRRKLRIILRISYRKDIV